MISNHIGKASSIAERYIVTEFMIDRTKNQFLGQTSRPWIVRKPWYRKSSLTNYSLNMSTSFCPWLMMNPGEEVAETGKMGCSLLTFSVFMT